MPEKDDDKKTHNKDGIHLRFMTPIGFPMYQNYVREINKRTSIPFFDQPMQGMRPDDTSVRDYDYTQLWVENQ